MNLYESASMNLKAPSLRFPSSSSSTIYQQLGIKYPQNKYKLKLKFNFQNCSISSSNPLKSSSLTDLKPYLQSQWRPILSGWLSSAVSVYSLSQIVPLAGNLSSLAASSPNFTTILKNQCLLLGLFVFARAVASYLQQAFLWEAAFNCVYNIRVYVFQRVLHRDLGFFEGQHGVLPGDVAYRISAEAEDIADTVYSLLNTIVPCTLQLSAMATHMLSISPALSLMSALVIPPLVLLHGCLGEKLRIISNVAQHRTAALSAYLNEVLPSILFVKASNAESSECIKFKSLALADLSAYSKKKHMKVLIPRVVQLMFFGVLFVFGATSLVVSRGSFNCSAVVSFVTSLILLVEPIQMPRHRRSTYRPPAISGTSGSPVAGSPSGGYHIGGSSQSQVPETPPGSSVGTSPMFADLSSDGCPYTVLTPGASWNGKPVLFPNGKKLWPPGASENLGKIIRIRREKPGEGGEKWSTLPDRMKHHYFDEMRKFYFIPNALVPQLWPVFETVGSECYKRMVCNMKASGVKPQWMGDDEWACWQEYWRDPFVQDMAAKNRANRLTEARDGTGTSRHHYGSRAVVTDRQMSLHAGEPTTALHHFKKAKMKNGMWTDPRAEQIGTEVEQIMEERMIDGHELTIREQDQIFFQVNPMDAKGRVYGLGSLGPSLTPGGSFSVSQQTSSSHQHLYTQEQVNELMNPLKQTIDQLLEQQAHINRRMDEMAQQMFTANQQPPPPPGS